MKTNMMQTLSDDFLNRNFIGYNRILDDFKRMTPAAVTNFPPYNVIDVDDETVDIELAVAGFDPEEISVMVDNGILSIESEKLDEEETDEKNYRYRGISRRAFSRSFRLAEYWEVSDAKFEKGILIVRLKQEIPEERKPKRIDIKTS